MEGEESESSQDRGKQSTFALIRVAYVSIKIEVFELIKKRVVNQLLKILRMDF